MAKLPASPIVDALHRLNDQLAVLVEKSQAEAAAADQLSPEAVFHHGRATAYIIVRTLIGVHIVAAQTESASG